MLRCIVVFIWSMLCGTAVVCQDAGIYEAGVTIDGINFSEPSPGNSINNKTFIKASGQRLNLTSAHINTYKKTGVANICSGYFFYRIYPEGNTAPGYSQITCNQFNIVNGTSHDLQDQEWFNNTINIDLISGLTEGTYMLDIYYGANITEATRNGCNDGPTAFLQNIQAKITITAPLNVQFTGFVTRTDNENVNLLWQITDSSELQYFVVEKSYNGVQWKVLDSVLHNGTFYTYTDRSPAAGLNYYRLEAIGFGKTFASISRRAYFNIIDNLITIYPNPVNKNLRFQMTALSKGRYQASVYASNGVKIAAQVINHDGNDNYVTIALPPIMSKGVYRLVLLTKNEFYKQNFLVQ